MSKKGTGKLVLGASLGAVLIDDDNRVLSESLKILGNNVIPIHVTSLLI